MAIVDRISSTFSSNSAHIDIDNLTSNNIEREWNPFFSFTLAAILTIFAAIAIIGNMMVLTIVIRHRGMRTRTNFFLVNMSIADLLVAILVMPVSIATLIKGKWMFGPIQGTFCSINAWCNCFCLVASLHTLMYISIHKHSSITKPLSSHFSLSQILGMIGAAWTWAAVSSTLTVTGLSSASYKKGTTQCGPNYPDGLRTYIFHVIIQGTNIFTPAVIIIYCYSRIFLAIRAHAHRMKTNSTLQQKVIFSQQKRATLTLFIVLAVFIVCALPFHLYATYTTVKRDKDFSPYLNPVAYATLYLNSAFNPIIYALRCPSFRKGYKKILCRSSSDYTISDGSASQQLHCSRRRHSSSSHTEYQCDYNEQHRAAIPNISDTTFSQPCVSNRAARKKNNSFSQLAGKSADEWTNKSSIIHNKDYIIIFKNGKIVSVRKQMTSM